MKAGVLCGIALLLVGLACACGSDDEATDAPDLGPLASARCEAYQRCSPEVTALMGGVVHCPERVKLSMERKILPGMNLDPSWQAGCVSALNAANCDQLDELDACETPAGTLEVGAACISDHQCATGACQKSAAPPACGVCAVPVGLGEPCSNAPCAEGLTCSSGGSNVGLCVEVPANPYDPPKVGDYCDPALVGDCGSALRCRDGKCATPVPLGASCTSARDCVWGGYCDPTATVCKTIELVGEGQSCDPPGVDCSDGFYCKGIAVCAPYVEDGGPCDEGAFPTRTGCMYPALCTSGICTLPTAETCE